MRREYRGGARAASLTQDLGGSTADLTITCDNLTNWPTGVNSRPFFVVIGRGTPTEEKILCSSRTANVLTVYNVGLVNGRGADETAISQHVIGAVIEHIYTATDANEANEHSNATSDIHGVSGALVGATTTQTLTNKTLTSPTITTPTVTGGSISNATAVTLTGEQTLASYRTRNVYAATAAPTAGTGNNGDLWVRYT